MPLKCFHVQLHNLFSMILTLTILLLLPDLSSSQSQLGLMGTQCTFKQGSNFNCRQYCLQYFRSQPQLGWYNITSKKCQPLKSCILPIYYDDYDSNQCYQDKTMKKIMPSYYPNTLKQQMMNPTFGQGICVNGMPVSAYVNGDLQCACYFMWENSKTYDMYGYQFYCDRVISPQKWKGYFLNDIIVDKNGTVLAYGPYTPHQLQYIYKQLKQKQKSQTLTFIQFYREAVVNTVYKSLTQEPWIREGEIKWAVLFGVVVYVLFGISYLKFQSQVIKVSKKQMVKRVKDIIEDVNAFQGQN